MLNQKLTGMCFGWKLEWLTSLPWPKDPSIQPFDSDETVKSAQLLKDRAFLQRAREQLDSDHYGLENVKKRLIEYLAVVRLRHIAVELEMKTELEKESKEDEAAQAEVRSRELIKAPLQTEKPNSKPKSRKRPSAITKGPILLFVSSSLIHIL
jgi:ATP-dependent Lon protease